MDDGYRIQRNEERRLQQAIHCHGAPLLTSHIYAAVTDMEPYNGIKSKSQVEVSEHFQRTRAVSRYIHCLHSSTLTKMGKPGAKALGKRKAPASKPPASKKSKAASAEDSTQANGRPKRKPDQPKKVKLRDQKTIPVPKSIYATGSGDEDDGMDSDMLENLGEEEGLGLENAKFLAGIDTTALTR